MMVWEVSEPYIALWLYDEPMGYNPGVGDRVSLRLAYKQTENLTVSSSFFSFGPMWDSSWLSYITRDDTVGTSATMIVPGGGQRSYTPDGQTKEYFSHSTVTWSGATTNFAGYTVNYPNGAVDYYNYVPTNLINGLQVGFLTQRVDPFGHSNSYGYTDVSGVVKLVSLTDADGRSTTLSYTNVSFPAQITGADDPFGRHVTLLYDNNGHLTNITDVIGLSSSVIYDQHGWVTNLTTPYGVTKFSYTSNSFDGTDLGGTNVINRSVMVTDTLGGTSLWLYRDRSDNLSQTNTTPLLPYDYFSTSPVDPASFEDEDWMLADWNWADVGMMYRNSFYWGPRQFAGLSTTNMSNFTTNDYNKARLKNWLHVNANGFGGASVVGQTLNLEIAPSTDGVNRGQFIWYDYYGKWNGNYYEGTNSLPKTIAAMLPDGTIWFKQMLRDQWGHITNEFESYSTNFAAAHLDRTNQYVYAANSIDLVQVIGPMGETQAGYSYNTNHQVLTWTNAVGDITTYTYDSHGRPTSIKSPAGLTTTNIYFASGAYTNWVQTRIDLEISRTNLFTYTNDLVYTRTDERGLITTNTYDNLQRLTAASDPRGTISFTYNKLDRAQVVDRLGFTNSFGYDNLRHLVAETNALGFRTVYNYCTCGALDSIQDAMGNVTHFYYDILGRLTNAVWPDGSSVTNAYSLLGQVTNSVDGAGSSVTNWFNNQGLQYAVSNYFGQLSSVAFDLEDRATNTVDANGVSITNTVDNLGRVLARAYPDGGVENFGYSTAGLIAYTNQLSQVTRYVYDPARRKTFETNANLEITQYSYDSAGDLLTLKDGKSQPTTWNYDIYGSVSNKVDAASNIILIYHYDADQRLTNRWSAAKGNTYYAYSAAGNLTNVSYPISPTNTFAYDALNRVTNMVDAAGTSGYTWDAASQVLSEDGPWASDTVSYTYNSRLRSSASVLQPDADPWSQTYAYDPARRLTNTTSAAGSFGYAYDAARQLQVGKLSLPNGVYITNDYDGVARLLDTWLKNSGGTVLNSHSYAYNQGNQRTQQVFTAGNFANYAYDNIGQLTTANGKESGGVTNRLLEQLGYAYDAAHNLNFRTNNALVQTFGVNNLNELSTITRSGTLTVEGTTTSTATNVTVNGTNAVLYSDATFAASNFTVLNGNNSFTAIAKDILGRQDTNAITAFLPASPSYIYDLNGNLTSDGTRGFDYDDENQLTRVTVTNAWKSEFTYDGKLRRRIRKEFTWNSTWIQTNEIHYIYDGNVVIQERDVNNLPVMTYTRGNDLSGSLRGAGGIGGLLALSQPSTVNPQHYYYHADGNGNITALVNAQQVIVAKYLYDPFGNVLSSSGALASINRYQFASKELDFNSGLLYYLYRFYDPNVQRWPNRDPFGENGFETIRHRVSVDLRADDALSTFSINGYNFVENNPIIFTDANGLQIIPPFVIKRLIPAPSLGGRYIPITCQLVKQRPACNPPGGIGPTATVCDYHCSGGGYSDEWQSQPRDFSETKPCGQSCSSQPSDPYGGIPHH